MLNKLRLLYIGIIGLLLTSCTEVIDFPVRNISPKVVIEGVVTDEYHPGSGSTQWVQLSWTDDLSNDNTFPAISGALVVLKDETDDIFATLTENPKQPGYYATKDIRGIPEHVYTLEVTVNNQLFSATSTMPQKVALQEVDSQDLIFFGDTAKQVIPVYDDPINIKNYYRFVQDVYRPIGNGQFDSLRIVKVEVKDDVFSDGNKNRLPIINDPKEVKAGDSLRLSLLCIDKGVFDYFQSFEQASGGADIPANPTSNIKGGALGYFSAHTVERKTIFIP